MAYTTGFTKESAVPGHPLPPEIVVSWDGKKILESDGTIEPARGVELSRGKEFVKIKDSDLNQDVLKMSNMGAGHSWYNHDTVYHFKLPGNVEVLTTLKWLRAVGFIKMPPQSGQDGWCGNFDGKPEDNGKDRFNQNQFNVAPSDDLFLKEAGLGQPRLMQIESDSAADGTQNATARYHGCDAPGQLEKAMSACAHLLQAQIYEACIMDVCETGETKAAVQAAEETSMMMAFGRKGKGKASGASMREGGCVCD